MELYFILQDGKLVITKNPMKGLQSGSIKKFLLFKFSNTKRVKELLLFLQEAYNSAEDVLDQHLILSNFLIHIEEFDDVEFKAFIVHWWLETLHALSSCLFPKNREYSEKVKCAVRDKHYDDGYYGS